MGEKVVADGFDLSDRHRYRQKLQHCLDGLKVLLEEKRFDRPQNLMGLEIELNLADADGLPRMMNIEVLRAHRERGFPDGARACSTWKSISSRTGFRGRVLDQLAEELRTGLGYAHRQAREEGARIVMIGILPTLTRRGPGLLESRRTSTATRCSTTRSWPRAARSSCSTSRAWSG